MFEARTTALKPNIDEVPKFSFDIFLKYNPICNPLIRNSPKFSLANEKKKQSKIRLNRKCTN